MKIAAMVLGIIGALMMLVFGTLGFGVGNILNSTGGGGGGLKFASLALPIFSLIGAGIVLSTPKVGASFMGVSAIGFIAILGFNFFTIFFNFFKFNE